MIMTFDLLMVNVLAHSINSPNKYS